MNLRHIAVFSICASLSMFFLASESSAQSGSRNSTSSPSIAPSFSSPANPSASYLRPQQFTRPSQPITNVYRPAAPMPQSNYTGYRSTNSYLPQPRSFTPHAGCNSTIALRAPRSNFTPAPVYQTQSPPVYHFPAPQYTAPTNRGFSPIVSRPSCANGNCRQ